MLTPDQHGRVLYLRATPPEHEDSAVHKIDGFKLYGIGAALYRISLLKGKTLIENGSSWQQAHSILLIAQGSLDGFLKDNIFGLQTSLGPGRALLETLKEFRH